MGMGINERTLCIAYDVATKTTTTSTAPQLMMMMIPGCQLLVFARHESVCMNVELCGTHFKPINRESVASHPQKPHHHPLASPNSSECYWRNVYGHSFHTAVCTLREDDSGDN